MSESRATWSGTARRDWVDYNGHLSEAYYVLMFGYATDTVMDAVGLDAAYRDRTGASLFTSEAHVRYLREVGEGDLVEVSSSLIGASSKVLWIWHELVVDGTVRATEEILGVHVDVASGRTRELPTDVRRAAEAVLHEPPPEAGRRIEVR